MRPKGMAAGITIGEPEGRVNAVARDEVPKQREEPTEPSIQFGMRIAAIVENMRAEGRFNLEMWLNAVEQGMGGTVVMKAPCTSQKRAIPEARYVPEGISISAQGTMFEQQ